MRTSSGLPSSAPSLPAALTGSLTRYGVAETSAAGSETASSRPLRSVIVPRRAGTVVLATCCVAAALVRRPPLTVPSQRVRTSASERSARKIAKRRPMRRSTGATSAPGPRRGGGAARGGGGRLLRGRLLLDRRLLLCGRLLLCRRRRGGRGLLLGRWRGRLRRGRGLRRGRRRRGRRRRRRRRGDRRRGARREVGGGLVGALRERRVGLGDHRRGAASVARAARVHEAHLAG